jgi:hypothetical protein
MQAYGSDRLRIREDGRILLTSRVAKPGWVPRVPKTLTHSEHPGTAILWDDAYYEVVSAEVMAHGGIRYELDRWKDEHVFRVADRYDEETEAYRAEEHRLALARYRKRHVANVMAIFTGHLPAAMQIHLGNELGINPVRMTWISAIPPLLAMTACIVIAVGARINPAEKNGWLPVLMPIAALSIDSMVRLVVAMTQSRPIGSFPGLIAYAIYRALSSRRDELPDPFKPPRGERIYEKELTEEEQHRDALIMNDTLFTLLSADEQDKIAARYQYDYRRSSSGLAWIILVFSTLGVGSSWATLLKEPRLSALISLLTAAYLMVEQIVRLNAFSERPAGSVLGVLVRPFVRKYLR